MNDDRMIAQRVRREPESVTLARRPLQQRAALRGANDVHERLPAARRLQDRAAAWSGLARVWPSAALAASLIPGAGAQPAPDATVSLDDGVDVGTQRLLAVTAGALAVAAVAGLLWGCRRPPARHRRLERGLLADGDPGEARGGPGGPVGAFERFALRGNIVHLAIGVVVGNAFQNVVTSLVTTTVMPLVALLLPSGNWRDAGIVLRRAPDPQDDVVLRGGAFLGTLVDFSIVSLTLFIVMTKVLDPLERRAGAT